MHRDEVSVRVGRLPLLGMVSWSRCGNAGIRLSEHSYFTKERNTTVKKLRLITMLFVLFLGTRLCHALDLTSTREAFFGKRVCVSAGLHAKRCQIMWGDSLSKDARNLYGNWHLYKTTLMVANPQIVNANKIRQGDWMTIPEIPSEASIVVAKAEVHVDAPAPAPASTDAPAPIATTDPVAAPIASVPSNDAHASPSPLSQPKGWYSATIPLDPTDVVEQPNDKEISHAAVFVDKPTTAGVWHYQEKILVYVRKDNDTMTVLARLPKDLESSSAIAFIAGGKYLLTGETLLRDGFAEDKKVLYATPQLRKPNHAFGFLKHYGLLAGENVAAVFFPPLWVAAAISDFQLATSKTLAHNEAKALQEVNEPEPAAQAQQ